VSRLQTIRVYKQKTHRVFTETLQRSVCELHKAKDEQLKTTLEQELNGDFHDGEGLRFVTSGRRRKVPSWPADLHFSRTCVASSLGEGEEF